MPRLHVTTLALTTSRPPRVRPLLALAIAALLACTTARDDLRRAEAAFAEARYEDVEAWTRELAPELPRMNPSLRARYYYLSGMSAFRMHKPVPARHALALCREELALSQVQLPETWTRNLRAALSELDRAAANEPAGTTSKASR